VGMVSGGVWAGWARGGPCEVCCHPIIHICHINTINDDLSLHTILLVLRSCRLRGLLGCCHPRTLSA
jgi:hypothetical protein